MEALIQPLLIGLLDPTSLIVSYGSNTMAAGVSVMLVLRQHNVITILLSSSNEVHRAKIPVET